MEPNNSEPSLAAKRDRPTIRRGRLTSRHERGPTTPELSFREHPGSKRIMYLCILICVGIHAAWHWSMGHILPQTDALGWKQFSSDQTKTLAYLTNHFTLKLDDVKQERWWTLITPAFSHVDPDHIIGNRTAFSTFSKFLTTCGIGPTSYSLLILGSAISGNLAFLYQASQRQPRGWAYLTSFFTQRTELRALGLSGVVMGLGVAISLTIPRVKVLVFGAVRMPMWLLMLLYILYDTARLTDQSSTVGHAAHLGGAAFGAVFYLLWMRNTLASRTLRQLRV